MMTIAATSITDQLLGQGILGVCVLVLAGVIVFLWKESAKKDAQIAALNESRVSDRDLRLSDSKADAKVILEVSDRYKETMLANTSELRELKEEIQNLRPRQYR